MLKNPQQPKICIVTLYTKEIEEESKISTKNKKYYCESYGYELRIYKGRLSERHAQWDKIQCIIQNLPEFDYVIWMDSDALFNNSSISFYDDIIRPHSDKEAFFCKDVCFSSLTSTPHLLVNTGVMVFKNTEWTSSFLNRVWNDVKDYKIESLSKHSYEGFPHEQGVLCKLIVTEPPSKYVIFEQIKFNTHPNSSTSKTFVIHFMGSRQSEQKLKSYIEKSVEITSKLFAPEGKLSCEYDVDEKEIFNIYDQPSKNKYCIVSHYTENLEKVASLTVENKKEYAKKHGYGLKIHRGRLSERHPGWDKILLLKRLIDQGHGYDYFVWMDNDTFITNQEIRFDIIRMHFSGIKHWDNDNKIIYVCCEASSSSLFSSSPKLSLKDVDFSQLENLRILNTGVFIIKNSPEAKKFLEEVWEQKSNTNFGVDSSHASVKNSPSYGYDLWPFEQGPFHIVLSRKVPQENYEIMPPYIMNTFWHDHNPNNFVCHFVGKGSDYNFISNKILNFKIRKTSNLIFKAKELFEQETDMAVISFVEETAESLFGFEGQPSSLSTVLFTKIFTHYSYFYKDGNDVSPTPTKFKCVLTILKPEDYCKEKKNYGFIFFDWDYSQCNIEHLSHSLKIDYENGSNIVTQNFDSSRNNFFKFDFSPNEKVCLFHSYEYFGKFYWKKVGTF